MWPKHKLVAVPGKETAVEIAEEVRKAVFGAASATQVACDLHEVCRHGGFLPRRVDRAFSDTSHDALLIPRADGQFSIVVDPIPKAETSLSVDIIRHRNRFRIAHEIGHSFFYDRSFSPPRRLTRPSAEEEEFCDEFASALLVPRHVAKVQTADPRSIFELQKLHDVSVEVAARSVARVSPDITIVGLLWKSHPSTGPGMRVVWSAGPRYLPTGVRLKSTVVDRAATVGDASAVERLNVGGLRGNYRVTASRLHGRKQLVAVVTELSGEGRDSAKVKDLSARVTAPLALDFGDEI